MKHDELRMLGLNPEEVSLHQERIIKAVSLGASCTIPIIDTCRIDNGGILNQKYLSGVDLKPSNGYISFIPAAGAATRYFKSFKDLLAHFESGDLTAATKELNHLKSSGLANWCLPTKSKNLLLGSFDDLSQNFQILKEELSLPKAIQPCKKEGTSYLTMKSTENLGNLGICAEVFVIPPGKQSLFARDLEETATQKPLFFLEQGPDLSTVRFYPNGTPYRASNGQLSPVPAGHGTLTKLVPKIKENVSEGHSLFIRNIDNVTGSNKDVFEATELFLSQHQHVLRQVKQIRIHLANDRFDEANQLADDLLNHLLVRKRETYSDFTKKQDINCQNLWRLQIELFQCHPDTVAKFCGTNQSKELLKKLFNRPVNALGQVPNSGKDIGGTPVFVETDLGKASLCLEIPHASESDHKKYLSNPKKATHFNPVFVAAELFSDPSIYLDADSPFWILAHKQWGSEDVVYHETVLYELLGNSLMANVMFPEIPRILFNPHKTVEDTKY